MQQKNLQCMHGRLEKNEKAFKDLGSECDQFVIKHSFKTNYLSADC